MKLGSYHLERQCGTTSWGATWLARAPDGAWVQADVMYPHNMSDDPDALEVDLLQWRRRLSDDPQPHTQRLRSLCFDRDDPDAPCGAVSDWIQSEGLDACWRRRRREGNPFSDVEAARLVREVCLGLEAITRAAPGAPPRLFNNLNAHCVRVDALGHAWVQALPTALQPRLVIGQGTIQGRFDTMSPEQVRGRPLTPASDVYQLGLLLYELALSRRPYVAPSDFQLLEAILQRTHVPPLTARPSLDPALAALIERAMAADPEDRPATAHDLRLELEAWLQPYANDDDPTRLDARDALPWLRDRLTAHDTPQVEALLHNRPDLALDPAVADYVGHHLAARVVDLLLHDQLPTWPELHLASQLPATRAALEDALNSGRLPRLGTLGAGWLLQQPGFELPQVTQHFAAAPAPPSAPQPQVGPLTFTPCSVRWDDLAPMSGADPDQQRRCDRCRQPVTRARSMGELIALSSQGCIAWEPSAEPEDPPPTTSWERLRRWLTPAGDTEP